MKLLFIDNFDSFTYNLLQILKQIDVQFDLYKSTEIPFAQLSKYRKIIISPGPGNPYEQNNLFRLIDVAHQNCDILGICLGHQVIAHYFGATLENLEEVRHGIRSQAIFTEPKDNVFENIPNGINIGRYHSWMVSYKNFPADLRITSLSLQNEIMAISHNTLNIKGLQFHPESIMTDFGKKMLENWIML